MNEMLEHFKVGAERLGPAKRGRKFPRELQLLAAQYANERRVSGGSWEAIANELGVALPTIRRWCEERPKANGTFARVDIIEDRRRETYTASIGALRFEGLEFDAIVALAKALS